MLADAEVLEHPGDQRFVTMPGEWHAVQHHPAAGRHAACERNRRSVEWHDVDGVSAKAFRGGVGHVQARGVRICPVRDVDRDIDVASRCLASSSHTPEHIGELDVLSRSRNGMTEASETLFEVHRQTLVQRHESSIPTGNRFSAV